jgi:cytoskeletal protein RodZ
VASFGENLRQAREARNITLQEIAASTKISSRALQALEDEHFEKLPGGVFNKGFVRAYARCVGLDEEKTIAEYLAAAKVSPSEIDMEVMSTQVAAATGTRQPWAPNAASVVGVLAVIVALGMGAFWLHEQRKENRGLTTQQKVENVAEAPAPATPAPTTVVTSEANPPLHSAEQNASQDVGKSANQDSATNAGGGAALSVTSSVAPSAAQAAASKTPQSTSQTGRPAVGVSAGPIAPATVASRTEAPHSKGQAPVEVSISATSRVWISVSSDGNRVETLTLDPEKPETRSRSYSAKEKLLLVVGNPAGLTVTYNGKPAGVLGRSGQRATITFTPEGIEKQ